MTDKELWSTYRRAAGKSGYEDVRCEYVGLRAVAVAAKQEMANQLAGHGMSIYWAETIQKIVRDEQMADEQEGGTSDG